MKYIDISRKRSHVFVRSTNASSKIALINICFVAEIVLISFSVEIDMENKEWQIKITENALTIGKINRVSSSKFRLSKWRPPFTLPPSHERSTRTERISVSGTEPTDGNCFLVTTSRKLTIN